VYIAFHFDVDIIKTEHPHTLYHLPILEKMFRSLLSIRLNNLHLKIFEGDLLVYEYLYRHKGEEGINKLLDGLLGTQFRTWREINRERLREAIVKSRVFVVFLEGVNNHVRDYLLHVLQTEGSYIGAIQILGINNIQWALYTQKLSPHYRYVNQELRLFYTMSDENGKDEWLEEHWKELPFKSVQWEDLKARHTIFDAYETFEHSALLVRLSEILSSRLSQLAEDVLLQAGDLNPKLQEILYASFKTFYSVQTPEEIAQVALSCRRFLENLADVLYPPRSEKVNNRIVDAARYRNRLWRYIEERLDVSEQIKDLVRVGLHDLGSRIDKIDDLANKGLHAEISLLDVDRLLIALVTVTYDLFSLAPPPTELPIEPHLPEITKFLDDLNRDKS